MQVAHPTTNSAFHSPSYKMASKDSSLAPSGSGSTMPPFRVLPRPKHGHGAVATRPIARGELILVEQPLVVQDDVRSAQSILSNLCRHPTSLTQTYLNLYNAFTDQMDPIVGIFNSNCIPLAPVDPIPHQPGSILEYGVFLQLSRFNNSCSPNASMNWDERRSHITVHAIQPIPTGTEITICYGQPLFAVRGERREYLHRTMGFWCTCSCCSLPSDASQASDARRTELWRLFKAVPFLGHDAPAGIRAATQALQTLQAEGLNLYQDSFAYEAYQFCMLLRNADDAGGGQRPSTTGPGRSPSAETYMHHAIQWLERAYQWKVITSGSESDGAQFFAQILSQLPGVARVGC